MHGYSPGQQNEAELSNPASAAGAATVPAAEWAVVPPMVLGEPPPSGAASLMSHWTDGFNAGRDREAQALATSNEDVNEVMARDAGEAKNETEEGGHIHGSAASNANRRFFPQPDNKTTSYNKAHYKNMKYFKLKRPIEMTDMNPPSETRLVEVGTTIAVDIGTIVNGYVLVFNKNLEVIDTKGKKIHDSWIKQTDLYELVEQISSKKEQRRLKKEIKKEKQTNKRLKKIRRDKKSQRPGQAAKVLKDKDGNKKKFIIQPKSLSSADEQIGKELEGFRINGAEDGDGTALQNYTMSRHTEKKSSTDAIRGTWNMPGTRQKNGGSGGIRASVPIGSPFYRCQVPKQQIVSADRHGIATFVYGYVVMGGGPVYMWILDNWEYDDKTGKRISGRNLVPA